MVLEVKGDFHIHTTYSYDGTISPRVLVKEALRRELRVLAVTDHNTFRGAIEVKRLASTFEELIVIYGIEWKTESGEVIILSHEPLDRIPTVLEDAVDYAKSYNSIVIVPHPFDTWRSGIGEKIYDVKVDAIEIFNPWSTVNANKEALMACKTLKVTGLANSDSHTIESLDLAYNILRLREFSEEEVFKCIVKGDLKPVGRYPSMQVRFKVQGKKILRKLRFYSGDFEE